MAVPTDSSALKQYLDAGYQLIPLHKWDRTSVSKGGKSRQDGKRPIHSDWTRKPYNNAEVVERASQGLNTGVRLTSEQLVVDVDPRNFKEGDDPFKRLCTDVGLDLDTFPCVNTGSGGLHVYMLKPSDVPVVDSLEAYQGVEFKSKGRQVVSAGSKHPDGGIYNWELFNPELSEAKEAPERLLALIRRPSTGGSGPADGGEFDQEEIASMLEALSPEDYQNHEDWLTLMQAVHHASGGEARAEFIDWSTRDDKYTDDAWIIGRRWDSLHRKTEGPAVTHRTLLKALRDAGREDAIVRTPPEEDFDDDLPDIGPDTPVPEHEKKGPLARMNDKYWLVDDAGKVRVMYEVFDPSEERPKWMSQSVGDFHAFHANRKVEKINAKGDPVAAAISEEWLSWPKRRTAAGVVFDPERDHKGFLNLWTGWAVEPSPRGSWSLMKELIYEVLCDGEEVAAEFVINWMAYMVQKPWAVPEVAICFHGEGGTGKSTLGEALCALAGRHGLQITSSEHLVGRFNAHFQDCLMLFADEAVAATDRQAQARLKGLISERRVPIEGKGANLKTAMNRMHVMIASNDDWFVPLSMGDGGERRFFVATANNSRKQDRQFFGALRKQLYEDGGLAAMLHDLQTRDLKGWEPRGNIPQTKSVIDQKLRNLGPLGQWWLNILEDGAMPFQFSRDEDDWDFGEVRAFYQDVKGDFEDFCRTGKISANSMNKGMVKFFGEQIIKL